jgi:hypothetical protein
MKRVLRWWVCWACPAGIRDFCSALFTRSVFCRILSSVFTRVILNFSSVSEQKIVFLYISCLHGFSLGKYILSMFNVKIPIHLKFTWTKKIRGCVMHCRQADTQWQTKNIATCNRINALRQS